MLEDLSVVLASVSEDGERSAYARKIIDDNCLDKSTTATRRLSNQRLGELFALDPSCPLFRVLRRLWSLDESSRPLVALSIALARDPLLMATSSSVLSLRVGDDMNRSAMRDGLRGVVGDRFNDSILEKVIRNTASSWTQSGHLEGRTFKKRRKVQATPVSLALALYLGRMVGFRGEELFSTGWTKVLDCNPADAQRLAFEAKRIGLVDLRSAGNVLELDVEKLDPAAGLRR